MPVAMPELAATASASSTISSRESTLSPCVSIPTLHFTSYALGSSPSAWTAGEHMYRNARAALSARNRISSRPLAQLGQQRRELFQAAQVVARQHQVGVLGRDHHPQRARPEVRVVALVRVHPYQAVAQPGKPFHRRGQDGRVAPVEAVG